MSLQICNLLLLLVQSFLLRAQAILLLLKNEILLLHALVKKRYFRQLRPLETLLKVRIDLQECNVVISSIIF